MLATKRSAGVTPEVKLREHVTHMPPYSSNKAAHSGFETQRRHHQKSKTRVSVAPQKGLMSSKNFLKKEKRENLFRTHFCICVYVTIDAVLNLMETLMQMQMLRVNRAIIDCREIHSLHHMQTHTQTLRGSFSDLKHHQNVHISDVARGNNIASQHIWQLVILRGWKPFKQGCFILSLFYTLVTSQ